MKRFCIIFLTFFAGCAIASAQQRLASPVLSVKEPSFADMSSASVSWELVDGAEEYIVTLNGESVDVIGNSLYLIGRPGTHKVAVMAKASGWADSEVSEVEINVRDYGEGTSDNPYLIYDQEDWNLFADAMTRNLFANNGFRGEYVALAANIDFGGSRIKPVSKNFVTGFQGTFDGRGRMLSNAVIEGGPGVGLFIAFRGVLKNLKASNIHVKSSVTRPSDGKAAVLCSGEVKGQIYNCMVMNSTIEVIGDKAGSYAAPVAAVLSDPKALVDRCISMNNKVSVTNTYASGLVGRVTAGTVINSISQNNEIYAGVRYSAGVAGVVCGPQAIVSHCLSSSNKISSGIFYAAGVSAEITAGITVNCTSEGNVITVEQRRCAGGIAGLIRKEGSLVNCLSKNCVLNVKKAPEPFAGLVFASAEEDMKGIIANCLVLSGSLYTSSNASRYIGIVGGSLVNTYKCADCYYAEDLIVDYNQTNSGRVYGYGTSNAGGSNYDCGFPVKRNSLDSMDKDSILNRLNAGSSRYANYGASEWMRGADGLPTIK